MPGMDSVTNGSPTADTPFNGLQSPSAFTAGMNTAISMLGGNKGGALGQEVSESLEKVADRLGGDTVGVKSLDGKNFDAPQSNYDVKATTLDQGQGM